MSQRDHGKNAADAAIEFAQAYGGSAMMAEDYLTDSCETTELTSEEYNRALSLIQTAFDDGHPANN